MKEHHFSAGLSRRLLRSAFIAAAIVVPILAAGGPVQAYTVDTAHSTETSSSQALAAASAVRSDPEICTTGSSDGNVETCMMWSNSGTHIDYIDGHAQVLLVPRTIKICVHSSVAGTIKCNSSGYIYVEPGGVIYVNWTPNKTEPEATYCVRTWRQNADGTDTLIGELCTNIT